LKTLGVGDSPKAPKEQQSTNMNSHFTNDARLAASIGSFVFEFVFILALSIVYLCTLYVKVRILIDSIKSCFCKKGKATKILR
jgi:hypothetical protein